MTRHQRYYKLICPNCKKDKKSKKLKDGYIICTYCGLVVYKIKYSLEQIDAPGFIKKEEKENVPGHIN